MMRLTHFHPGETLRLDCISADYSVYRDRDGNDVYLEHGTANRLHPWEDLDLVELWTKHHADHMFDYNVYDQFRQMLCGLTIDRDLVDALVWCNGCVQPLLAGSCRTVDGGTLVCSDCFTDASYWRCYHCDGWYSEPTTVDGEEVCDRCLDSYYIWCDHCDRYCSMGQDHSHDGGCCESPAPVFTVPNDGQPPLRNDTRGPVTLPAGIISDEGIGAIASLIRQHGYQEAQELYPGDDNPFHVDPQRIAHRHKWDLLSYSLVEDVGVQWQGKRGNFTKRLSKHAYEAGLKIPPDVLSRIGNLAADHSRGSDIQVETTRYLNEPPGNFANDESCWWSSEYRSRCALKTNGGFALRSYDGNGYVSGRAWVMPLRRGDTGQWEPTFETMTPDAYVVFNGYEALAGYTGPRILAQMTGWTYRKIGWSCSPMWINSESGYLVACEEIAQQFQDGAYIGLDLWYHSDLYEAEQTRERQHV
jgi:hypothetical protein